VGRVPSPNDVFSNFEPWATARPAEVQNSLLNDPPTAYFTLMSLAKSDWRAFHWNPYIAAGIPGWGSSAAAVLSPFILLPVLVLPLAWVWTGIIFIKINVAYFFAYLWLREERLGKRGTATGAMLFAASGPFAVRWFWQLTNATALYPALLWVALRTARGKRTPLWATGLIALAYALAGFPATMAYGAYVAAAYFVYRIAPHLPVRSTFFTRAARRTLGNRESLDPRAGGGTLDNGASVDPHAGRRTLDNRASLASGSGERVALTPSAARAKGRVRGRT